MAALLGGLLAIYSAQAWLDVSRSSEFELVEIAVEVTDGSGDLAVSMRQDVLDTFAAERGTSLFDPELVTRVGHGIGSLPWVEEVVEVQKVYPRRLRALLRIRRPVVAVALPTGESVLLDEGGARLPDRYYPASARGEVPLLEGLGPRPSVGQIQEGIRIIQELQAAEVIRLGSVRTVDLANIRGRRRPGESEILLRTAAGVEIEWGRSVVRALDEPSPKMKMDGLREVLGRYPALVGVRRVRLQFHPPGVELVQVARSRES